MNNDLDNQSDLLYSRLITWLIEESAPAASISSEEGQAKSTVLNHEPMAADFELDQFDPLDFEEWNIAPFDLDETTPNHTRAGLGDIFAREETEPGGGTHPHNLGERLTVQNRFQELLKRRLQVEIELNPPLFPWETEFSDYEPDTSDVVADTWVPPVRLWMPQLSNLTLPVSLPETVLAQLLDALY
ncbi:MAG: hypothetical protein U7123_20330 [Potamolinea sp.]